MDERKKRLNTQKRNAACKRKAKENGNEVGQKSTLRAQ